jgi:hypothetical protein
MTLDLSRTALLCLALTACGDAASNGADAGGGDAGQAPDAGSPPLDGGLGDAGADGGSPDAGDTWTDYAQGFFATYCTSCHTVGGAGDPTAATGLDFTQYADVQANGPTIRCGVGVTQDATWDCTGSPAAEQFPICNSGCTNPKPTAAERDRLVAWVSAGMPE